MAFGKEEIEDNTLNWQLNLLSFGNKKRRELRVLSCLKFCFLLPFLASICWWWKNGEGSIAHIMSTDIIPSCPLWQARIPSYAPSMLWNWHSSSIKAVKHSINNWILTITDYACDYRDSTNATLYGCFGAWKHITVNLQNVEVFKSITLQSFSFDLRGWLTGKAPLCGLIKI